MKRRKAEYFFRGDSLICKGLPSGGYFSAIWKAVTLLILWTKKFPYFIMFYYLEWESCINGRTLLSGKPKLQYNLVIQTVDNLTQITISLGM